MGTYICNECLLIAYSEGLTLHLYSNTRTRYKSCRTWSTHTGYSEVEEGLPITAKRCLAFTGSGRGACGQGQGAGVGSGLAIGGLLAGPLGWSSGGDGAGVKVRVLEDGTDVPGLGKLQEGPWRGRGPRCWSPARFADGCSNYCSGGFWRWCHKGCLSKAWGWGRHYQAGLKPAKAEASRGCESAPQLGNKAMG